MISKKEILITFNQKPSNLDASGGGDSMSKSIINFLLKKKIKVNYKLSKKSNVIFINNAKSFFFRKNLRYYLKKKRYYFNYEDLIKFNKENPKIPILVRVNDTDAHRKSDFIDKQFIKLFKISSLNIFVSKWVKHYFKNKAKIGKNLIIENIPNEKIFNLKQKKIWKKNEPFKIITHHWSNNIQKGYDRYFFLDKILLKHKKENIEFELVGNYPENIKWRTTKLSKPLGSYKLANKLKSSHCYITGSRYEAGALHILEALKCGLPTIYFNDGGTINNVINTKYGIKTNTKNLFKNILIMKKNYFNFFRNIKKKVYKKHIEMTEQYYSEIMKQLNRI